MKEFGTGYPTGGWAECELNWQEHDSALSALLDREMSDMKREAREIQLILKGARSAVPSLETVTVDASRMLKELCEHSSRYSKLFETARWEAGREAY